MANILLTNNCNQKCPYCFAIGKIQNGKLDSLDELSFENLKIILNFLEKSRENKVRLMGGEPTLHSKFKEFIDYILSQGFAVHLFTNGLFSSSVADFLVKKESVLKYSFNINHPSAYSKKQWETITDNLQRITSFRNSVLGVVIWQEDFNLNYVLDLISIYFFKDLVLRLANPIIGKENIFIPENRYPALVSNLVREIKKFKGKNIPIDFGCGLVSKMFTKKIIQTLKNNRASDIKEWGCDGNTGRFDIVPDLSVFRCFPLSNWHRKTLTDFNSTEEVESYFVRIMQDYQSHNSNTDFLRNGPCFAFLLNKKLK